MKIGDIRLEACGNCKHRSRCQILYTEEGEWSEEAEGFFVCGWNRYTLYKCCGCEHVFFTHEHWFSEDPDSEGKPTIYKDYNPPIPKRIRPFFEFDFCDGPFFLWGNGFDRLTREIYSAFNSDLTALAAMGTRAILEKVMNTLVGDEGGFAEKVKRMVKDEYLSRKQEKILTNVLELGHSAIHRGHIPDKKEVELALDIIETLIQMLMHLENKSETLSKRVPARKKSGNKTAQKSS